MSDTPASSGTALSRHQQCNVHALSVACPKSTCRAEPGERCQGAVSHPNGYYDTLHKARERELFRRLDEMTVRLTKDQAIAVRALFDSPSTMEQRLAVANVLLRPEQRLPVSRMRRNG
jgi:hypothetical protein